MSDEPIVVLCTCPDEATARGIATALIADRLAACVNRIPGILSSYLWPATGNGQLQEDAEMLLVIKTTADRYPAVEAAILARHPYEVPEVIALPIVMGSRHYIDWIRQTTRS